MAEVGRILGGRYRLIELLGQGGMATIYRAQDGQLGRDVAVKLLRVEYGADPAFLAGVLDHVAGDEALLLAVAEHAGVTPQDVEHAQAVLSGRPWQREVP
mgnify:CR=1 FL=1